MNLAFATTLVICLADIAEALREHVGCDVGEITERIEKLENLINREINEAIMKDELKDMLQREAEYVHVKMRDMYRDLIRKNGDAIYEYLKGSDAKDLIAELQELVDATFLPSLKPSASDFVNYVVGRIDNTDSPLRVNGKTIQR